VIADIQLKKGTESEFKQWFAESNKTLSKLDGFVSRSHDCHQRYDAKHDRLFKRT